MNSYVVVKQLTRKGTDETKVVEVTGPYDSIELAEQVVDTCEAQDENRGDVGYSYIVHPSMKDSRGIELKVGQTAVIPHGTETMIVTVTELLPCDDGDRVRVSLGDVWVLARPHMLTVVVLPMVV